MKDLLPSAILLASSLLPPTAARAEPVLQPNDRVAICGDSITEAKWYSLFIADYLLMCQPEKNLRVHQFGWSGEWARGFVPRIETDVIPFRPTVVTTCYGMNDGAYSPVDPSKQKSYRQAIGDLIATFKKNGARVIIIGTPGVVDSHYFNRNPEVSADVYNHTLSELGKIAGEVAAREGVGFANLHDLMREVMVKAKARHGVEYAVAGRDGVHPGGNGHLVMAYAFLKAMGVSGEIGSFTLDWASGQAAATDGHRVISSKDGTLELESKRYPFCFDGDPADSLSPLGILEFLPFNQDLNRLLLVVKNLPPGNYRVTWGAESKDFPAEELGKGVNLADQFLKNPFKEPFFRVQAALFEQQKYETVASKELLHSTLDLKREFPGDESAALIETIQKLVLGKADRLMQASRDAVVPVKHVVQVVHVK